MKLISFEFPRNYSQKAKKHMVSAIEKMEQNTFDFGFKCEFVKAITTPQLIITVKVNEMEETTEKEILKIFKSKLLEDLWNFIF